MAINKNYILSENVTMYPTALRGGTDLSSSTMIFDPESRLTTEFNITTLINRLSLSGSFVISDTKDYIELSIHGYYFKLLKTELVGEGKVYDNKGKLYACIRLDSLGNSSTNRKYTLTSLIPFSGEHTNLDAQDGTNEIFNFVGLYFTDDATKIDNKNTFGLLVYENGKIPHDSWFKFDPSAIKIENGYSLHDVIFNENDALTIKAEEFKGHLTGNVDANTVNAKEVTSHVTGNVKGDLDGNAKTATDSAYATKIGTKSKQEKIGDKNNLVYIDTDGSLKSGIKFTCSKNAPTDADPGNDGDIWYQYA